MTGRIVTANRLRDGAVVFRTKSGAWSSRVADAALLGEAEAAAALAAAQADAGRQVVVAPYLAEAEAGPDGPVPVEFRERIRAAGPTIGLPGAAQA
ncbi:DUF2849 domain-containing protein [Stella sp.]|uniref:DUF2849 domain-containing protein n=1 Tax=Stella sp. TaxID=2912054 RepID=UPI0035AF6F23